MRKVIPVAGIAVVLLLTACEPTSQASDKAGDSSPTPTTSATSATPTPTPTPSETPSQTPTPFPTEKDVLDGLSFKEAQRLSDTSETAIDVYRIHLGSKKSRGTYVPKGVEVDKDGDLKVNRIADLNVYAKKTICSLTYTEGRRASLAYADTLADCTKKKPTPKPTPTPPPPPTPTENTGSTGGTSGGGSAHRCTVFDSSGNCAVNGRFCANRQAGQSGLDANGTHVTCRHNGNSNRYHWTS